MFNIIVAMCKKTRGIGFKNGLPFYLPEDLKRFQKITTGDGNNSVIMGSKTWRSLPAGNKPLKNRENIILSRRGDVFDLNGGSYLLNDVSLLRFFCKNRKYDENWVIGGGEIYKQVLETGYVKKIFITEIESDEKNEYDTYFPEFDKTYFELQSNKYFETDELKGNYKIFFKKLKKM